MWCRYSTLSAIRFPYISHGKKDKSGHVSSMHSQFGRVGVESCSLNPQDGKSLLIYHSIPRFT